VSAASAVLSTLAPGSAVGVAVHDDALHELLRSPSLAGVDVEAGVRRALETGLAETGVELTGGGRSWVGGWYPLEGGLVATVAIDVTEHEAAAARLYASRERLDRAQALAGLGSWAWDARRNAWTWSDELFRMAGLDPGSGAPDWEPWLATVAAEGREAVRAAFRAAVHGEPFDVHFRQRRPDGTQRIVRSRGGPVHAADGTLIGIAGFAQDVTELKQAEDHQRAVAALGQAALAGLPVDDLGDRAAEVIAILDAGPEHEAFHQAIANVLDSAGVRLRAEAEIAEQAAARGRLVAQALDAEDRTRREISELLHDGPLQDLLALNQALLRLDAPGEHLERARGGIGRAITSLREIMVDLHPVAFEVAGLESTLGAVVEQQARHGDFACEIQIDPAAGGLRDDLVIALVRELLINAAKHADASSVRVELRRTADAILLEVADDGAGIPEGRLPAALREGHIGLASSTQRVEAVGGTLTVSPAPGGGTAIAITLPV